MKKYHGFFDDLINNYSYSITEQEFYYKDTVELYDQLSVTYNDYDFFYKTAILYGGPVLDLCCGTGRLLIPMARKGFKVTGVDLSTDMLSKLETLLNTKYKRIKDNVELFNQDVESLNLNKKYNFVMIGATSIRLLAGDFTNFFNQIYTLLNDGGCFCFDFEDLPANKNSNDIGEMITANLLDSDKKHCILLMQRFIDYTEKMATVNMVKIIPNSLEKILITNTQYKIFDKNDIEKSAKESSFKSIEFIPNEVGYFCKLIK